MKNGEVLIINNHWAPSLSEGEWKNQHWLIIKADNECTETQSKQLFPPSGDAVLSPETWPVRFVLWPSSASSHKFCEQGHSLDRNWVTFKLTSYQSVHCICKFICICTHCKLYLHFARIANCICILFNNKLCPTTHFLLKLVNQKLLALHIGLQYHAQ